MEQWRVMSRKLLRWPMLIIPFLFIYLTVGAIAFSKSMGSTCFFMMFYAFIFQISS